MARTYALMAHIANFRLAPQSFPFCLRPPAPDRLVSPPFRTVTAILQFLTEACWVRSVSSRDSHAREYILSKCFTGQHLQLNGLPDLEIGLKRSFDRFHLAPGDSFTQNLKDVSSHCTHCTHCTHAQHHTHTSVLCLCIPTTRAVAGFRVRSQPLVVIAAGGGAVRYRDRRDGPSSRRPDLRAVRRRRAGDTPAPLPRRLITVMPSDSARSVQQTHRDTRLYHYLLMLCFFSQVQCGLRLEDLYEIRAKVGQAYCLIGGFDQAYRHFLAYFKFFVVNDPARIRAATNLATRAFEFSPIKVSTMFSEDCAISIALH